MKIYSVRSFFIVLCLLCMSITGMGQATRTWVSGVGDDVNPCSRTAPCKTLAGAISKTAVGGEISILDPGGFGAVTITKSITIDGGGIIGSILSSATTGIIINAPDGLVTIRNFSINGAGTTLGTNGIRVMAVKKLNVESCVLANFSEKGIDINPTSTSTSSPAEVLINDVTIHNVRDGISIGSGQTSISNSVISGCDTAISAKTGANVYLSGNVITNNRTALQGQGKISTAGNNSVWGNKTQGITATVVKMQ